MTTVRRLLDSRGDGHILDITSNVAEAVRASELSRGVATVFVTGSTAGLTTIEYEPGLVHDLTAAFEHLYPQAMEYRHHETWGDDNGHSHVRASMLGPSLAVPFVDHELTLGTWQQIILVDFDTRPRSREFVIQMIGES
ncbi:MAG: secondary thiamine-phosphate synthase enzyme YjbQ [Acidobacteriota bacterium]|nr:MAG: secondary thiamine-phosphate synthase enzyme YjbQ [Acidobacteriota bacterium]